MPVYRLDRYRSGDNEMMRVSNRVPDSIDARYFGPIARDQIESVMQPFWTW
jgi:type IV secretory pathway protease TraF